MTAAPDIRRRPDGSIDTDFYIAAGRRERSAEAHATARQVTKTSGKLVVVIATLGLSLLFRDGQV